MSREAAAAAPALVVVLQSSEKLSALYQPAQTAFLDGLRHSGFRIGEDLAVETRTLKHTDTSSTKADDENKIKRDDDSFNRSVIRQIAASHPELVLALGTEASDLAASDLTNTAVVYAMVFRPPAAAGANTAGVTLAVPPAEQFRSLQSLNPAVRRIGVVYDPTNPISAPLVKQAADQVPGLGLTLVMGTANSPEDADKALDRLKGTIDALWIVPDTISASGRSLLWAAHNHTPVIGLADTWVTAGALVALFPNYSDIGSQAAELAAKILRGVSPSSLVVRGPRRTLLWINENTARTLGITIPAAVRDTADHVVESGGSP